jgi:hypothetical protein
MFYRVHGERLQPASVLGPEDRRALLAVRSELFFRDHIRRYLVAGLPITK